MSEDIKNKIIKLENIQSELNSISTSIKKEDAINIEKAWSDRNSNQYILKLTELSEDIQKLSNKINDAIESVIKSSGGANNE